MIQDRAFHDLCRTNFERHRQAIYVRTDRMFGWAMAIQYALVVVLALTLSPRTWNGGISSVHPHVWMALFLGMALAALPIVLTTRRPGEASTRYTVAFAQGLFSALLIDVTGGRIETHFHVFGSLAFLAMYRDWRALAINSAVVALDHAIRGTFAPATIYGVGYGAEWRFMEHAAWVLFEDAFLFVACAQNLREMRGMAGRQAELELANERVEEASSEIRRQSAILNSVLTGMHDAVSVVDREGRFVHLNPAALAILGEDAADVRPEEWAARFGLVGDDGAPANFEALPLVRAMRGVSVINEALRVPRADTGELAWLEVGAEPLLDAHGARIGGVAVFRDVTERRRTLVAITQAREDAERANRAKSEFLSRMSHELRTPLNAIIGFGNILQMDELTEDQDDSVAHILRAGDHLLRLINEVLDLSGIEAGKLTISLEPVDAFDVIEEVALMVRPLAAAAGVTVGWEGGLGEALVLADRQRLLQSLLNLVSNGIKYNVPGGRVEIGVETGPSKLGIVVRDTGPGIPEEKRSRLFNPFERLGAQNTAVEGTGLGLALTKRLVEAMEGEITLRPSEVGACFVVELLQATSPLRVLEGGAAGAAEGARIDRPAVDVLLVEDNPINVRLVERVMAMRPHVRLHVAGSGLQGLEKARELRPGLVLLDLDLPDVQGGAVLRRLRWETGLAATPVAIVSADATSLESGELAALEPVAHLLKPFEIAQLLAVVDNLNENGEARNVA